MLRQLCRNPIDPKPSSAEALHRNFPRGAFQLFVKKLLLTVKDWKLSGALNRKP